MLVLYIIIKWEKKKIFLPQEKESKLLQWCVASIYIIQFLSIDQNNKKCEKKKDIFTTREERIEIIQWCVPSSLYDLIVSLYNGQ